jgi:O-antigen/teichoic acid export membrane protein
MRKGPFAQDIAKLFSGKLFAQAVGFASIILLARLYSPEAFGVLGVFMAVAEIGGRISTLRYDAALVLPKEAKAAWGLLRCSVLACLLFSLGILLVSYPFRDAISSLLGAELLALYFPLIALMILGIGCESLGVYWTMRGKHFDSIGQSSAGASLLGNGVKIVAGYLGFGPGGLLVGTVIQRWLQLLILCWIVPKGKSRRLVGSLREGVHQAKIFSDFPKYRMPQEVLNALTRQLPTVLIASFFSPVAAGFYILSIRVLQLPFGMLQSAFRKVFYVRAIEAERDGDSLFRLSSHFSILIAIVMIPLTVFVFLCGNSIFEIVFGAEWSMAGSYAKWVMLFLLFSFCSVPVSTVIPVIGLNRFFLVFEASSMLLRLSVVTVVAMTLSAYATVVAIAICSSLSSLLLTVIVLKHLRSRESDVSPNC